MVCSLLLKHFAYASLLAPITSAVLNVVSPLTQCSDNKKVVLSQRLLYK